MALNLIKREVSISTIHDFFDLEEVFYIVWHRGDSEYFFVDCSEDNSQMKWSEDKTHAIKFYGGNEAMDFMKEIKKTRKGPGVIELKILTEKTSDMQGWMI